MTSTKCQMCLLLYYEDESIYSLSKGRSQMGRYFYKMSTATRFRIGEVKDIRSLHLCTDERHRQLALDIRKGTRASSNEEINKKRSVYKEAMSLYKTAVFKYTEELLRNGQSKEAARLRALKEHYKVLKGQRLRRLQEAIGRVL